MKALQKLIGRGLDWVQTRALRPEFVLRDGDEPVATLALSRPDGASALATCAEGRWTFERAGFLHTEITIRSAVTGLRLGVFRRNLRSIRGTLTLDDGRQFSAALNPSGMAIEFQTEAGEPLLRLQQTGRNFGRGLQLTGAARTAPMLHELPWLAELGWYLVMLNRNAAAAAG